MRLAPLNSFKTSNIFTDRSKAMLLLLWIIFVNMFHVCLCYAVLPVHCSLVFTCWDRTDNTALLCVMFSCVFATFPYGVHDKAWYLIESIPDRCRFSNFMSILLLNYQQIVDVFCCIDPLHIVSVCWK